MDVAAWLHGLGLQRYEQAFRDNEVDARVLPRLTAEDLKEARLDRLASVRLVAQIGAAIGREFSYPLRCVPSLAFRRTSCKPLWPASSPPS